MKIVTGSIADIQKFAKSVVTIGNFDGVHCGHVEIFKRLKLHASALDVPAVVVTFHPHPLSVLHSGNEPLQITTLEQKLALIEEVGIDAVVVIEFTPEFSSIPADTFVRDFLCGKLGMQHIIIGHDYAFGQGRQGNYKTLEYLGRECGFTLEDIEPIGDGETIFSSSLVRFRVGEGEMAGAASILGRYYHVSGVVVHGCEMGGQLGFPTANIVTNNQLVPPNGVYAVMVAAEGKLYKGACSIGTNPTFGSFKRTIEAFLLDFSGKLYESEIAICFVQRLRDMKKFPDLDSLIQAIRADVELTRDVLSKCDTKMINPLTHVELIRGDL